MLILDTGIYLCANGHVPIDVVFKNERGPVLSRLLQRVQMAQPRQRRVALWFFFIVRGKAISIGLIPLRLPWIANAKPIEQGRFLHALFAP